MAYTLLETLDNFLFWLKTSVLRCRTCFVTGKIMRQKIHNIYYDRKKDQFSLIKRKLCFTKKAWQDTCRCMHCDLVTTKFVERNLYLKGRHSSQQPNASTERCNRVGGEGYYACNSTTYWNGILIRPRKENSCAKITRFLAKCVLPNPDRDSYNAMLLLLFRY